jgi:hypothetical protein
MKAKLIRSLDIIATLALVATAIAIPILFIMRIL